MSSDFEAKCETYSFSFDKGKWTQVADMNCARLTSSGLISSMGQAYAIGGTIDQVCEKYDPSTDVWQALPSYKKLVGVGDGLFSYAFCLTKGNLTDN